VISHREGSHADDGEPLAGDGDPELVSHRDYCPGNVVFRDGLPAALIDFDLARPTTRLYDITNALYWWAPLYAPEDRAPAFTDADIPRRAAVFADAYGMSAEQRRDLVPLAHRMIHRFHLSIRAAAEEDPVFRALWEANGKDRLPRAETWIEREGPAITAQLTATPTGNLGLRDGGKGPAPGGPP
jgi:Ser/Thr protein kinase RdoA (MazF antagonist)